MIIHKTVGTRQELETLGCRIVTTSNGEEALATVVRDRPDVILLDILMPKIDGYEVCRRLKADDGTRDIPVIFMTALSEVEDKLRAFTAGGVDYVTKPFQSEEVTARVRVHLDLRRTRRELSERNQRLQREIDAHNRARQTIGYLREEIKTDHDFEEIIGDSPAIRGVLNMIASIAGTDSTVLIQGETGTGKELVARAIHDRSGRAQQPLVKVNCAALPHELIESELFGHERGAFTGATRQRKGRFELADGGTIFLDEVGELSAAAQAKLLRVLQEHEIERVGGSGTIQVDVRVIAATNRELESDVEAGSFRSDLFYRLNVFPITVPPLRERLSDVPLLTRSYLYKAARNLGKRFDGVSEPSLAELQNYHWPGNVRELQNVIERAAILSPGPQLEVEVPSSRKSSEPQGTLEQVECAYIRKILEQTCWVVEGDNGAARRLGLNPSTLRGRMRKLGIEKPK